MEIEVRKRSLAKALNSERGLLKKYGRNMANAFRTRLGVLQNAPNLAAVPTHKPVRRHLLRADRAGEFAVDLVHPYRLVFKPNHSPVPRRSDGGVDTKRVTAITIIDVVDYH